MLSDEILQESSYYQKIFNRGVQLGREQALAEAREEGRIDGERRLVRWQLALKFGTLPDSAEEKLRSASKSDLERWAARLLSAGSIDEILD